MAKGTTYIYEKFMERLGDAEINLSTVVVRCALTSDTTGAEPGGGVDAVDPRWGAGGTEDVSTNEVTAGGGYTAGGELIDGGDPWDRNTSTMEYTANNANWTSAGSGDPINVRYGVMYTDDANKYCVGFVQVYDGGTDVSLLAGDITIKWSGGASTGIVFNLA